MKRKNLSEEFQKEWEAFLSERGHKVELPKGVGCVLQSKNAGGKRYRWLLFIAGGKSKTILPLIIAVLGLSNHAVSQHAHVLQLDLQNIAGLDGWRLARRARVDQVSWLQSHMTAYPADDLGHVEDHVAGALTLLYLAIEA